MDNSNLPSTSYTATVSPTTPAGSTLISIGDPLSTINNPEATGAIHSPHMTVPSGRSRDFMTSLESAIKTELTQCQYDEKHWPVTFEPMTGDKIIGKDVPYHNWQPGQVWLHLLNNAAPLTNVMMSLEKYDLHYFKVQQEAQKIPYYRMVVLYHGELPIAEQWGADSDSDVGFAVYSFLWRSLWRPLQLDCVRPEPNSQYQVHFLEKSKRKMVNPRGETFTMKTLTFCSETAT